MSRYLIIIIAFAAHAAHAQQLFRYPVVGAVTDRSAVVQAWLASPATVALAYGTDAALSDRRVTQVIEAAADNDFVVRFTLDGLEPSRQYYYRVESATGASLGPVQMFSTFPTEGIDAPLNILFGSCQQRRETDSGLVFDVAGGFMRDMFIQLGDWTYPDRRVSGFPGAPGSIRESYAQRYDTTYPFARDVLSQMGVAYVWDDHDYWRNNADGSLAPETKRAIVEGYRRYLPHYPMPNDAGVWHSFRMGNAEFFMVDARSQRRPVDEAYPNGVFDPPPGHSMLAGYPVSGADQRTWLADAIRRSTARWKILVSPVFFNPAARQVIALADLLGRADVSKEIADKWVGYPADIDTMRTLFDQGYGRNLLIVSGDAHVNVFDDGTRSLRPEFLVGNLDVTTTDIFSQLSQYNITLWSQMQSGLNNTVGRIAIETSPKHRLIVESYDENGEVELRFEMIDSTTSAVPAGDNRMMGSMAGVIGRTLHLQFERIADAPVAVELYDVTGREVYRGVARADTQRRIALELPSHVLRGTYLGRVVSDNDAVAFRVVVRDE